MWHIGSLATYTVMPPIQFIIDGKHQPIETVELTHEQPDPIEVTSFGHSEPVRVIRGPSTHRFEMKLADDMQRDLAGGVIRGLVTEHQTALDKRTNVRRYTVKLQVTGWDTLSDWERPGDKETLMRVLELLEEHELEIIIEPQELALERKARDRAAKDPVASELWRLHDEAAKRGERFVCDLDQLDKIIKEVETCNSE